MSAAANDLFIDPATNPFTASKAVTEPEPQVIVEEAILFPTSILKLVVMSLATFGLYPIYWFYKNWKYVFKTHGEGHPLFYAIFSGISFFGLSDWVAKEANKKKLYMPWMLYGPAFGYLTLSVLSSVSDKLSDSVAMDYLHYSCVLMLIPVQMTINELNRTHRPNANMNSRFSALNIVGILVGGGLTLLLLSSEIMTAMGMI